MELFLSYRYFIAIIVRWFVFCSRWLSTEGFLPFAEHSITSIMLWFTLHLVWSLRDHTEPL